MGVGSKGCYKGIKGIWKKPRRNGLTNVPGSGYWEKIGEWTAGSTILLRSCISFDTTRYVIVD